VDKNTLKFFKIDGVGLVDGSKPPGFWADDQLIAQNSGWMVEIPANIAPGHYVLRHEMYVNFLGSLRKLANPAVKDRSPWSRQCGWDPELSPVLQPTDHRLGNRQASRCFGYRFV
jgi:hypothetical protein